MDGWMDDFLLVHHFNYSSILYHLRVITSDKGGDKCVCPRSFVCVSVCLLARLLKNACMNMDKMLRVNRCRVMDELI